MALSYSVRHSFCFALAGTLWAIGLPVELWVMFLEHKGKSNDSNLTWYELPASDWSICWMEDCIWGSNSLTACSKSIVLPFCDETIQIQSSFLSENTLKENIPPWGSPTARSVQVATTLPLCKKSFPKFFPHLQTAPLWKLDGKSEPEYSAGLWEDNRTTDVIGMEQLSDPFMGHMMIGTECKHIFSSKICRAKSIRRKCMIYRSICISWRSRILVSFRAYNGDLPEGSMIELLWLASPEASLQSCSQSLARWEWLLPFCLPWRCAPLYAHTGLCLVEARPAFVA